MRALLKSRQTKVAKNYNKKKWKKSIYGCSAKITSSHKKYHIINIIIISIL